MGREWGEVKLVGEMENLGMEDKMYRETFFLLCGFCNNTLPYLSKKISVEYEFFPDI